MWEKIKTSLPVHILMAAGIAAIAGGLLGIARETIALRAEYVAAMAKIGTLWGERARLSARITELATPEAVEREAKEKLNLKKKGERVVVVVPDQPPQEPQPAAGRWQKMRGFLLHLLKK